MLGESFVKREFPAWMESMVLELFLQVLVAAFGRYVLGPRTPNRLLAHQLQVSALLGKYGGRHDWVNMIGV